MFHTHETEIDPRNLIHVRFRLKDAFKTEALDAFIRRRLTKAHEHGHLILWSEVVVDDRKHPSDYRVRITAHLSKSDLCASATHSNPFAAVRDAFSSLQNALDHRRKTRRRQSHSHQLRSI